MTAAVNQRMENASVPRLVLTSSVPLMISTLSTSLYNLVDSMFVARWSEPALTATIVAYPISLLLFSVTIGTAMGVNSRLSRFLGEGRTQDAKETGWTGIFLSLISCLPFMAVGAFTLPYLFPLLTIDPEIAALGQEYSRVILVFCTGHFFTSMGARLLQATGRATLSMVTQLVGAVLNCALDPIMIFGLLGCPAMGIRGAAIATVISQCVSGALSTALYFIMNPDLRLSRGDMSLRLDLLGDIYRVGVPTMLTMALSSFLMMLTNRILQDSSKTAAAFYGIFSRLQTFTLMPITGLGQGIVPVIGYFYGAKQTHKLGQSARFALRIGLAVMGGATAAFCLLPDQLMSLFSPGEELLAMGHTGLRVLAISFVPLVFVHVYSNVFTGIGNGKVNLRCSVLRGVLPIPLLLLLLGAAGVDWCWFAFVIADALAAVYALLSYNKAARQWI